MELMEGGYGSSTDGDTCETNQETNRNKNRKSKRNRTTFTDEQIHILQANFQLDCNPDGQDLERIADISGLSKRVVQVRITEAFWCFEYINSFVQRSGFKMHELETRNILVRTEEVILAQ